MPNLQKADQEELHPIISDKTSQIIYSQAHKNSSFLWRDSRAVKATQIIRIYSKIQ